eukprot:TRINITY_DN16343_c0_g4_i1.p1 TRINITY_DN16343_c0_g4~~TRINITY_DN16343_c0_g4_i1.p1  ORF type:complete len:520 (-),score=114.30 TRINITY_DN16343_c0_g4_i1:86-1645(-)
MIDYDEGDWLFKLLFRIEGSVGPRACLFAIPSALIAVLLHALDDIDPEIREIMGLLEINKSMFWSASVGITMALLNFRARQSLGRFWEGTSLLHQMRGEWFDAVSCLMTFSRSALETKPEGVREFRHCLVRLTSFMHGSALEEIQADEIDESFDVLDIQGFDRGTLRILKDCKEKYNFNRVEVLLHMIQVLITQNLDDGILKIAPPILSRVYQTLSRGLVNLLNAKKITDTRFPFPFVQIITFLLMYITIYTPIIMTAQIEHRVVAPLVTFVPVFGMFYMNFVAIELEMPFGDDDNDLPLRHFQDEMNGSLLMLLHANADHLPRTGRSCVRDWKDIAGPVMKGTGGSNTKSLYLRKAVRGDDSGDSGDDDDFSPALSSEGSLAGETTAEPAPMQAATVAKAGEAAPNGSNAQPAASMIGCLPELNGTAVPGTANGKPQATATLLALTTGIIKDSEHFLEVAVPNAEVLLPPSFDTGELMCRSPLHGKALPETPGSPEPDVVTSVPLDVDAAVVDPPELS